MTINRKYKMHITWGMHKHNPRTVVIWAPVHGLKLAWSGKVAA